MALDIKNFSFSKINRWIKDWIGLLTAHWVGLAGVIIVTIFGVLIPIFISIILLDIVKNPYFGLFSYMVLPLGFIAGLGLIPVGYYLHKKEQFHVHKKFPTLNLNIPDHRVRLLIFILLTVINIMIIGLVSYGGLKYMDSVSFCGKVCHGVMKPQYTAYMNSPHSRVKCVECHIGSGAPWFVKSKISGLGEVLAVAFNTFGRPILQPVINLRPARDTCEQCHWPEKFYGDRLVTKEKFRDDEKNTPLYTVLRLKVGGKRLRSGNHEGIHWHVDRKNQIFYKALDHKREKIVWVKMKVGDKEEIFVNDEYKKLSKERIDALETREMDCVDCHNRPTHIFYTKNQGMDMAMSGNQIDRALPFIKREGLKLLNYETREEDEGAIRDRFEKQLFEFYQKEYPKKVKEWEKKIEKAANGIAQVYNRNVFPGMNVTWGSYSNFLGHSNDSGCFRCHDSEHSNKDESKTIPQECNTCHDLMLEEEEDKSKMDKLFQRNY